MSQNYKSTKRHAQKLTTKLSETKFTKFLIPAPDDAEKILSILKTRKTVKEDDVLSELLGREDWAYSLSMISSEVNAAKMLLEEKDIADRIGEVLKICDLYGGLRYYVQKEFNGQHVTNAWLKMYEMIVQLGLIPQGSSGAYRVFFNSELPGAFTVATNHYMKTMCPDTKYDWVASSYYPPDTDGKIDVTKALGDKYGLYQGNKTHWIMDPPGGQNNGDVTDINNILDLAKRVKMRWKEGAMLYTSDAGIDVSGDYSRQEEDNSLIDLGQLLLGVLSLAKNGDLIVKQYTYFRPFSVCVLVVFSMFFGEFYITKPLTSRPTNSEIYIVGRSFQGAPKQYEQVLVDLLKYCKTKGVQPADINFDVKGIEKNSTIESLLRATREIHQRRQTSFLKEAVDFAKRYKNLHDLRNAMYPIVKDAQNAWLNMNHIKYIGSSDHLSQKEKSGGKISHLFSRLRSSDAECLRRIRKLIEKNVPDNAQFADYCRKVMLDETLGDTQILHKILKTKPKMPPKQEGRSDSRIEDIKILVEPLVGKNILYADIGCSEGEICKGIADYLKLSSSNAFGVDIIDEKSDGEHFTYVKTEGKTISLPDDAFNIVTVFMAAHHFEFLDNMLTEIRRIMKKKAILIIREHDMSSDNPLTIFLDVAHALYSTIFKTEQTPEEFIARYYSVYRSISEWIRLFEKHGFTYQKVLSDKIITKRNIFDAKYAVFIAK